MRSHNDTSKCIVRQAPSLSAIVVAAAAVVAALAIVVAAVAAVAVGATQHSKQ